ncbi:MAG: P-loop NTPase [Phycisphaerae bacterium]|nr:P-loop NTPase [Phycisphaerae bacterium]
MKITIASGKGGTGKATIATNLAYVAAQSGKEVAYIDCDVEEPNGHLFLHPTLTSQKTISIPVPKVDEAKCIHCQRCAQVCRFSAIVCVGQTVLVNPQMCHGCGGCTLVCPSGAIEEENWPIGVVDSGVSGAIDFARGVLKIGVAISPPLIRAVKSVPASAEIVFVDAPPGTSCPVVETVRESDYVVLVTEPTPFGLNDLKLAVEMVKVLERPMGIIVNRADTGNEDVFDYCRERNIPVLGKIVDDRAVAEAYSRGELISRAIPKYAENFQIILKRIFDEALLAGKEIAL